MKRTDEQQYIYNQRCIAYLDTLIKSSMQVRYQTPPQAARVFRWRRVRRALQHDQIKLQQSLPAASQLHLADWQDDAAAAQAWFRRQLLAFMGSKTKDLFLEGVQPAPTPSGE